MSGVRRIRLTVRYDGTDFAGSQVQPARRNKAGVLQAPARTVSRTLTTGLEALLEQPLKLFWASRTDSGVHADGNVCVFDASLPLPLANMMDVLNRRLPLDLRISRADEVAPDWHPRFDAVAREYVYRVWRGEDPPYDRLRFTASYAGEWNEAAVTEVRRIVCGKHNYAAFAKDAAKAASTVCDLQVFDQQEHDGEIHWRLRGNRFLRQMVCNLAGTLLAVAAGKVQPQEVAAALQSGIRSFKTKPAPPRGLVLTKVIYLPETSGLAG